MIPKEQRKKGRKPSGKKGRPFGTIHLSLRLLSFFLAFLSFACRPETSFLKVAGVVDGDTALVLPLISGQLTEYYLKEGMAVQKGQIAARMDTAKLDKKIEALAIAENELRVNRAKIGRQVELLKKNQRYWQEQVARLKKLTETQTTTQDERLKKNQRYWQEQVARLKKLTETQTTTQDELERAQLQLEQIEAELEINHHSLESLRLQLASLQNQREELELVLKDYTVLVPADGVVLESYVTSGEIVLPGKPLARILVKGSLFIEVFLEEKELSRLKPLQEVSILVDGLPGELQGEIYFISQEAEFSPKYIISEKERKTLLYQVKIRVKEEEEILKLGMPVTVLIKPEDKTSD